MQKWLLQSLARHYSFGHPHGPGCPLQQYAELYLGHLDENNLVHGRYSIAVFPALKLLSLPVCSTNKSANDGNMKVCAVGGRLEERYHVGHRM